MAAAASKAAGKRVGGALYLHVSAIQASAPAIRTRVEQAAALAAGDTWNVVKVSAKAVSLLLYEDFDESAFPALLAAARVYTGRDEVIRTDYRGRANPPILHRKEMLLLPSDPRRPAFTALTRMAEERGLFSEPHRIGTRDAWLARLRDAGFEVKGSRLIQREFAAAAIARHRTAIIRRELSQPMQLLIGNGAVAPGMSVFDYGCGQGDDVAALAALGFDAFGWDPHHAKEGPRREADIVNLGFVLNVIEDRHEREETLKAAWSFARDTLCVAVMTLGKVSLAGLRPYLDGYLTSRGTFQKYFGQQELRELIEQVLGEVPVALGSGIFAVFRDKEMEQEVLVRRRSRAFLRPVGIRSLPRARTAAAPAQRPALTERILPELERLWGAMLERGRILEVDEFPIDVRQRLESNRVSASRATALCITELFDQADLVSAATTRTEDYLVHFAMTLFPGAPRYTSLPRSIQRDVRAFFGSHAAALDAARELLFSAGRLPVILEGVETAVVSVLGAMRDADTLRFQVSALNRLPAVLRVLVGCAAMLRGGVEGTDFVDVKLDGRRLVFLSCIDGSSRLPIVVERTRVDLTKLRAAVDKPDGLVLYLKGRFLPYDASDREAQMAFDQELLLSGAVSQDGRGPPLAELHNFLRQRRSEGPVRG